MYGSREAAPMLHRDDGSDDASGLPHLVDRAGGGGSSAGDHLFEDQRSFAPSGALPHGLGNALLAKRFLADEGERYYPFGGGARLGEVSGACAPELPYGEGLARTQALARRLRAPPSRQTLRR